MMAAVAIGAEPDMAAAVRDLGRAAARRSHRARSGARGAYDALFPLYQQTRQAMRPIWRGLAAHRAGGRCMTQDRDHRRPFMRAAMFEDALRERRTATLAIRAMELPWPDEPMEHGYAGDVGGDLDGLKEYHGRARRDRRLRRRRRDPRDPSGAGLRAA